RNMLNSYEAARPSRARRNLKTASQDPNLDISQGAESIRGQVRHLMQNYDIAKGSLRVLTNSIIGPEGIQIEASPKKADGTVDTNDAKKLKDAWDGWAHSEPDISGRYSLADIQRLVVSSLLRDGEVFAQKIIGNRKGIKNKIPFSLELIEADNVPFSYTDI